jgi:phosphoglycolate phosphatase
VGRAGGGIRTVVFDWDGTIVDSMQAVLEADREICRVIGVPFDESIFRRVLSPNWRGMYRALGIPEERWAEAYAVWTATFRTDRTQPFPGVEGALARLAAAGCRLGLVTGNSRTDVEPQVVRLGFAGLLPVRVYGDDMAEAKPDPRPLRLALELAGTDRPEDAVYLGDTLDDVRMAAAAGVRAVGILSRFASADELAAAGAMECATSVVEWVDRFLG